MKELSEVYVFTHLGAVEASLLMFLLGDGKILLVLGLKSSCDKSRCSCKFGQFFWPGLFLQRNGNS